MGLRFKYGAYATAENTARPATLTIASRMLNTFPVSHIWTLSCEVLLLATGSDNLTTAANALSAALQVPYADAGIQYTLDGGSNWYNTQHFLTTSGSFNGVVATTSSYNQSELQYATEQWVTITLVAEYSNTSLTGREILRQEERVEILGEGGAISVLRPQWNAASIYQELKPYSDVQVVQSGVISGRTGYPSLPSPLIGTSGARDVRVTRDGRMALQDGVRILEYQRQYSYTFNLATAAGTITPGYLT